MNSKTFNKRAQIGTTVITLVATIAVISLLIVFVISSTFITKLGKKGPGEVGVMDEESLGIRDVVFYPYGDYIDLVKIRKGILEGRNVKELILEVEK